MRGRFCWKVLLLLVPSTGLFSLSSSAQSDPPPNQGQAASPAGQDETKAANSKEQGPDTNADNLVKSPLPASPEMEVRPIGGSTALPTYDTLLRWGPVYVRDIELLQSYDRINALAGASAGTLGQRSFSSSILRADIVYDRQIGQNRLTLQYAPRLTMVNGRVSGDYMNQTVGFDWIQQLSPRWTLGISNTFSYFSVRNIYGDYFLDVNAITGTNVPSSFLDAGGSWLNTTSEANFGYALSPTSSISVAPFFGYGRVTGQLNATDSSDLYQYGAKFGWNKRLTPFRSISASYYYRIVGALGNGVPYQSGDVGISQQLGASTTVGATIGFVSEGFSSGRQSNFSTSLQLARRVGRSVISIGYFRGFGLFSELNAQGVAQRVEATYRLDLSQRWYTTIRGGYEDSLTSSVTDVSGKYVSGEFGYNLNRQFSLFVSYAHKTQSGADPNLLAGTRDYALAGIRWTARPAN
jgi:hypothetical protein